MLPHLCVVVSLSPPTKFSKKGGDGFFEKYTGLLFAQGMEVSRLQLTLCRLWVVLRKGQALGRLKRSNQAVSMAVRAVQITNYLCSNVATLYAGLSFNTSLTFVMSAPSQSECTS